MASASMLLIAMYLSAHAVRSVQLPLGLDAPVYIWASRYAAAVGFDAPGLISRPAAFALVDVIAEWFSISHSLAVAILTPVAVVMAAFATAALASEIVRRRSTTLVVIVMVVTGAFLTRSAGYLSAVLSLALIAGCLWGLLLWWDSMKVRLSAVPIALFVILALTNTAYFWLALGLLGSASIICILLSGRSGKPSRIRLRAILVAALVGVLASSLLAFLMTSSAPSIDTSADAFTRRVLGLEALSSAFREQLPGALTRFGFWVTLASLAAASVRMGRAAVGRAEFIWVVLLAWIASIPLAVMALLVGLPLPAHRLMWSTLPLAVLIGTATYQLSRASWHRDDRSSRCEGAWPATVPRSVLIGMPATVVILLLLLQWVEWRHFSASAPTSRIRAIEEIAEEHASTPAGTSLILVADDGVTEMTGNLNWLRSAVVAERIPEVIGYPGTYEDFMERRPPRITGAAGSLNRLFEEDSWSRVVVALRGPYVAVSASSLDAAVFDAARDDARTTELGRGVVVLRKNGYVPSPTMGSPPIESITFDPHQPFLLAPVALLGLTVLGWGWARWFLPDESYIERLIIAPTVGFTLLALTAIGFDLLGVRLAAGGAVAATFSLLVVGAGLWATTSKRR